MEYISFASSSSGNCALLRFGGVDLLIDAGISMKRIRMNLRSLGLDLGDLRGVLVTHEHSDHVSALGMLSKYTDLPFFLSRGTGEALLREYRLSVRHSPSVSFADSSLPEGAEGPSVS